MRYTDFDLWIDARTERGYPVRAACVPQGEARDVATLDADTDPILSLLKALGGEETEVTDLVRFGSLIYGAVFRTSTGDVEALLERSYGGLHDRASEGLRIRLRLEAPQIASLPWELLYSPRRQEFIGTRAETALVRYVEVMQPVRPLQVSLPVNMLVAIPVAAGLDSQAEKAGLEEALHGLEREVQLTILEGVVTRTRLSDALLERRFHLLHFIGHGGFSEESPFLVFNDPPGGQDFIGHREVASLLLDHPTLKLVVLNSCQGATVSSSQPLVGMAAELVKRGLPAVVAMQYPIRDRQAVLFAREFYRSLFKGWAKGWIEVAISHARRRLEGEFPGDRALGTPVLFTRAPEGVLFDLLSGSLLRDAPFTPDRLSAVQALARAHERDLKILNRADGGAAHAETDEPGLSALGTAQALADAAKALKEIRRRIRFRNVSLATASAVTLFVFFLSWMYVFDRLPAELKIQSYTTWMADALIQKSLSDRIRQVVIGPQTFRRFHDSNRGVRRREYARLIDVLTTAGAPVIAFDVSFPPLNDPTPADGDLAAAIARAHERGTRVVVGVREMEGDGPRLAAALRAVPTRWGSTCIGHQGLVSPAMTPLLTEKRGGAAPVPSLVLAALAADEDRRPVEVDSEANRIGLLDADGRRVTPLDVSWVEEVVIPSNCPTIGVGDRVAFLVVDPTPLPLLRDPSRRLAYEDLLPSDRPVDRRPPDLTGKIVIVGEEAEGDAPRVQQGLSAESRYGFEVQADALNTLLQGVVIRPLGTAAQLTVTLALSLTAALLRSPGLERRAVARRSLLVAALAAYLAAGVCAYVASRLMVNTVYHLAALFLTYAVLGKLRKWWVL